MTSQSDWSYRKVASMIGIDSPGRNRNRRRSLGLLFWGVSCIFLIRSTLPPVSRAQGDATSTAPATLADDEQANSQRNPGAAVGSSGSTERIVSKLIPDFEMLQGSPATKVVLLGLIEAVEGETAADQVSVEVIFNKKSKVVAAEIVDNRFLLLTPGAVGKSELIVEIKGAEVGTIHSKFNVEVWVPDYWKLVFTVIGGLGIFLLGMKSMSDGLQAVAGNRLRKMIAVVTNNRLMATGVGTLVTMILQSSSITTVMVVGFVNSGFMTLSQSIGVIFGANIGTTITGWILVLKIGKYGLPIAGAAAFGYLFLKRDRWRYTSMALMGLGMVFLGLELMKDGFAIIKELPAFEQWFERFTADTYFGVLKCAAVGCVLTFIVQSSSATLGITIGLAQIGVIPFETAAALVLGENIGTTITAWLASFGATTNAKRAAYAHIVFNVLGVAWITAIFPWYIAMIKTFVGGDPSAVVSTEEATAAIAATHTGFNVANTVLFLPLAGLLASVVTRLVPDRTTKEEESRLTNLDVRMLESPVLALEQSHVVVVQIADGCQSMMSWLKEILKSQSPDLSLAKKAEEEEQSIDVMQDEVVSFMTRLLASNIPEELIDEARRQLRMADEYESVSDYVGRIIKYQVQLHEAGLAYDEPERRNLLKLHDTVEEYLQTIAKSYRRVEPEQIDVASQRGRNIAQQVRTLRHEIMNRMADDGMHPRISVTYNRQINAYRRVRDHAVNIAEAISGLK